MRTAVAHVHAGEPTDISPCPRCSHVSLCVFPLTGLTELGVAPVGVVTVCVECGSAAEAVREFLGGVEENR
ncbi:hypothetical protein [Nocardia sp. CA-290969]|uniref:hypothetical protein n=1 Tax=Nocardia sp. CA-290969 TaxID=3239986 RepID=UPI003D8D55F3